MLRQHVSLLKRSVRVQIPIVPLTVLWCKLVCIQHFECWGLGSIPGGTADEMKMICFSSVVVSARDFSKVQVRVRFPAIALC